VNMSQIDAIVIGSGFGAAMAAYPLVHAGWRVVILERGGWVRRGPHNWAPDGVKELSAHYDMSAPYTVRGDDRMQLGGTWCVGGQSVFFGGVSLRFREKDFTSTASERAAGAVWPFGYDELEPYYTAAERIMGVAGAPGSDPTEPWRSESYPQVVPPLSRTSCRIADAAARIGFHPFRLPLAINYGPGAGRRGCIGCNSCDCYACGISAKNDMASAVLPDLIRRGMELVTDTAAVRLRRTGRRISGVECVNVRTGERSCLAARNVIVAAGALATPQLLITSGAAAWHPAGRLIGRMLMRHCNAIVFGVFARELDPAREFHKQLGINDLYFGHSSVREPAGRLGTIQQVHAPPPGLVPPALRGMLRGTASRLLERMTGLIAIASDQPQLDNRIEPTATCDALGIPGTNVYHRYTARDRAARAALLHAARAVMSEAGAVCTVSRSIRTFSHGLGTVRMGATPDSSPLEQNCRLRGADNLYVTDASTLPTSSGVNPSLTIAAVALRAGCMLAGTSPTGLHRSVRNTIIPEVIHA
jgi:choline dehydrogenase-like flavoprotein